MICSVVFLVEVFTAFDGPRQKASSKWAIDDNANAQLSTHWNNVLLHIQISLMLGSSGLTYIRSTPSCIFSFQLSGRCLDRENDDSKARH